jgi:hypothetical protein
MSFLFRQNIQRDLSLRALVVGCMHERGVLVSDMADMAWVVDCVALHTCFRDTYLAAESSAESGFNGEEFITNSRYLISLMQLTM